MDALLDRLGKQVIAFKFDLDAYQAILASIQRLEDSGQDDMMSSSHPMMTVKEQYVRLAQRHLIELEALVASIRDSASEVTRRLDHACLSFAEEHLPLPDRQVTG